MRILPLVTANPFAYATGRCALFYVPFDRAFAPPAPVVISVFEADLLAYLNTFGLAVYPGHIPETAILPALSYFVVGADPLNRLSGAAGLTDDRIQIAISGPSALGVLTLSEQLRMSLQGFKQAYMGGTFIGVCLAGNQFTQFDGGVDASDRGTHTRIREFLFTYEQSIPTF